MTLNGRYAFCCRKDASFGAHHKKLNEDRPIRFLRICSQGFSGEGVKRQWGNRKRRFSGLLDATSSAFWEMRPTLLYNIILSPVAFPVTPKYMTLNDLDGLFGVKFCFRAGLAGWDRATSENNCVKTNEDRHILLAVQIFGKDSSFCRY